MVTQGIYSYTSPPHNTRMDGLNGVPGEHQVVGSTAQATSPVSPLSHCHIPNLGGAGERI